MARSHSDQTEQNILKYHKTNKKGILDKVFLLAKDSYFFNDNYHFFFLDENLCPSIFKIFPIQFNTGLLSGPTSPIDSTNNSSPNNVAMVNKIDPPKLESG